MPKRATTVKPSRKARPVPLTRRLPVNHQIDLFKQMDDRDFYSDNVQHVYLYNSICAKSVTRLKSQIRAANRDHNAQASNSNSSGGSGSRGGGHLRAMPKPIVVHMNSNGGDVTAGLTMLSVLSESLLPICVLVDGVSASAATFISLLAPYRVMTALSCSLIHEWHVNTLDRGYARRSDLEYILSSNSKHDNMLMKLLMSRVTATRSEVDALMLRDKVLDAPTCLKLGFVDRIIRPWAPVPRPVSMGATDMMTLLRRPDANHVQLGPLEGEDGEDTSKGYGLANVRILDKILASDSNQDLRPVVIHISHMSDSMFMNAWMQLFPTLARIGAMRTPVVGVIDSQLSLHEVLPILFCKHRAMYETATIALHIMYDVGRSWMLQDIIDNTQLLLSHVGNMLREHTRLPPSIINNLHIQRLTLTAADCLRYGIVDAVLPVL